VHIYDFQQKTARQLKVSDGRVTALAVHPSGKFFATGGYRQEVRIWNLDGTLQGESRFEGKSNQPVLPTSSLTFSPDGDSLVVVNNNPEMSLQIFDLKAHLVDTLKVPNAYPGPAIAFSKSGKWLAAGAHNNIFVWDWPNRKLAHVFKGHSESIEGLSFMPDVERLVSASRDATTRVWRIDNGYSMALLSHGSDWINYAPDGYFDASHYGGDLVSITRGMDTFGIEQFALKLNRPDIIFSRMGIGTPEFVDHLHSRYQRRLNLSGVSQSASGFSLEAPEVHLLQAKQDGKFAQIEANFSDPHFPLLSYQIYVNNVPLFPGRGKSITGLSAQTSDRIELGEGENKVEISAFNNQGVEALRAHWSAIYRANANEGKSDLYYIGFGISHYRNPALNLRFAHKDVLDLNTALQRYKGSYRNVITRTYIDDAVTPENILKAGEVLKNAGVDDTVVILVSGHGAYDLSKEATYYFGTYDLDVHNLAATAVSFDQIESLLRDIAPRHKLLLLDTCESGEMDEATRAELLAKIRDKGLSARTSPLFQLTHAGQPKRVFLYERDRYIYNDLARRTGSIVFSASHAGELSIESSKIQNGVFTHAILEALGSNQADTDHDGKISVDELEAFVTLQVGLQTGGLQRPTVDRDNIDQRFSFPLLH
ncbi:MAG: caspase family protein, partial [Terracidiphilus sp.]